MPLDDVANIARPQFCPQCHVERPAHEVLCLVCGEKLRDQGYCGICERYWLLSPGAECPKHEVALGGRPRDLEPLAQPGEAPQLVTVGTFANTGLAEAVRIRLEAEGIPTLLQGERMGDSSMYPLATGGIRLQVPQRFAADARILLDQTWEMPDLYDDLDDAWEELAPDPWAARRSIMKGLILVILIGPFAFAALVYWLHL